MDKKKILLVSLGHLSCDINGGALPAILPFVRSAFGLSYQATGGLIFAYSCLSSMIQPLFGLLSDRFSKPWFIPLGVLLAGCGLAAIGWMPGYWGIFAAIGLSGIGAAIFHPEGARFANAVSGQNKGTGMSLFSIGGNGGFVLGPLLATACLGAFGLKGTTVFAVLAVMTAGILVWSIARMGATKKKSVAAGGKTGPAPAAEGETPGDTPGETPVETPGENNWREFSKLTVSIVTRSITFAGFNTFIPLYWVSAFGQSETTGAFALTFFSVCGVISNFFGGMLSDRFGYRTVIRMVFALLPPVVAGFSLSHNLYAAWALLPLLGFVLYAPFSAQVVLGQQYLAKNIGFASGITLGLATSLGGVVAPLLGWIADNYGMATAFQSLAVLSIVGAIFAYSLKPITVKKEKKA